METSLKRLLPLLLLLTLPTVVEAQFIYTTNNGTITITGYAGSGGAVTIPDSINGLPVTSIGSDAFESCSNLTDVTIPDSVATIVSYTFQNCTNLANPAWFPLQTNILTGGSSYFSDPQWTNYPARFYRLRSP